MPAGRSSYALRRSSICSFSVFMLRFLSSVPPLYIVSIPQDRMQKVIDRDEIHRGKLHTWSVTPSVHDSSTNTDPT